MRLTKSRKACPIEKGSLLGMSEARGDTEGVDGALGVQGMAIQGDIPDTASYAVCHLKRRAGQLFCFYTVTGHRTWLHVRVHTHVADVFGGVVRGQASQVKHILHIQGVGFPIGLDWPRTPAVHADRHVLLPKVGLHLRPQQSYQQGVPLIRPGI